MTARNATEDLDVERLRVFYARHGFTALDDGQPLPPLLGQNRVPPTIAQSTTYFHKQLRPTS